MIVYHVDRNNTIVPGLIPMVPVSQSAEGRILDFASRMFPDGISHAGHIYMQDVILSPDANQRTKETEFEYIRRLFFADRPSRFQSFFAAKSLKDAALWRDQLCDTDEMRRQSCIWEIAIPDDGFLLLDAAWRDRLNLAGDTAVYSVWENFGDAFQYWQGEHTETPRLEIVVSLAKHRVEALRKVRE